MKYLKLYEDFKDDALYDVLTDKGHERRPELDSLLAEIEHPDSEEAEMWSDEERKRVDDFLSTVDIPGWKAGDPVEKKITGLANSFKSTMGSAKTTIEVAEKAMGSEEYAPKNIEKSKELEEKLEELQSYLDEMDSLDGWWTGIRQRLQENPSVGIEVKNLIDLTNATCKEIDLLQKQSDYTYKGFN
jgi:hypothetical protein